MDEERCVSVKYCSTVNNNKQTTGFTVCSCFNILTFKLLKKEFLAQFSLMLFYLIEGTRREGREGNHVF